jgi:hypothetical protein
MSGYENPITNDMELERPNGTGEDSEEDVVETAMTQIGIAESLAGDLSRYTVTAIPESLPYAQADIEPPSAEDLSRLTYKEAVHVINEYTLKVYGFLHPLLASEERAAAAGINTDENKERSAKINFLISDKYKREASSLSRKTESPRRSKLSYHQKLPDKKS